MTHDFDSSYRAGIAGETFLDNLLAAKFTIEQVSRDDQRRGIDRYFTSHTTGNRFPVEYKTDHRAADTGNAFIETVSVDSAGKAGWAYKSAAQYLLYYLPQTGVIYCLQMTAIRKHLPRWRDEYPTTSAQNDTYNTHGILVPLSEFEALAEWIIQC